MEKRKWYYGLMRRAAFHAGIIFMILKLTDQLDWSWLWIISPFWLWLGAYMVLIFIIHLLNSFISWGEK